MDVRTAVASNRNLSPFPNRGKQMQFYNACLEKAEETYAECGNVYGPSPDAIARACVHVLHDTGTEKGEESVDGEDILDYTSHEDLATFIEMICDEVLTDNGMPKTRIIRRRNWKKARRLVRLMADMQV